MDSRSDFIFFNTAEVVNWVKDGLTDAEIQSRLEAKLKDSLLKKAFGYEVEETKTFIEQTGKTQKKKVEKTTKHLAPDPNAIGMAIRMLNRREK